MGSVYLMESLFRKCKAIFFTAGDGFVELRQSTGPLTDENENNYAHQVPLINDCVYRHAGEFRYIAVYDIDEVIVPRQSNVSVIHLLQSLAVKASPKLVHTFTFRNAYYYRDDKPVPWNTTRREGTKPLPRSLYLSWRRRSKVWHPGFNIKYFVDADGCSVMSVHYCQAATQAYTINGTNVNVPETLGFKHHYRQCNLDSWGAGNCVNEKNTSTVDDAMLRYADRLTERLYIMYSQLNLTQT